MRNDNIRLFGGYAGEVSFSVIFDDDDVARWHLGLYEAVSVRGCYSIGAPGQPKLPWKKTYVSVPWDAVPRGDVLKYEIEPPKELGDCRTLEPGQRCVPTLVGNTRSRVEADEREYCREEVWPKRSVRVCNLRRTGGFAMIELEVCPLLYFPRKKELSLIKHIEVTARYDRAGEKLERPSTIMAQRHEEKHMHRVRGMVVNPDDVCKYAVLYGKQVDDKREYGHYDYVIITSDELAEKYERLVDHRTRLGHRSRIVTTREITEGLCGAVFYEEGSDLDLSEGIRNFIKWANIHWLTDYFLLGGGPKRVIRSTGEYAETIPSRKVLHSKAGKVEYGKVDCPGNGNLVSNRSEKAWTNEENKRYMTVSIDAPFAINRLEVLWQRWCGEKFTFEVSRDGVDWHELLSQESVSKSIDITFECVAAIAARLCIINDCGSEIDSLQVFGPCLEVNSGIAFRLSKRVTRICLGTDKKLWPSHFEGGTPEDDLLVIKRGCHARKVVRYDCEARFDPSWRFIERLWEVPSKLLKGRSQFIEVCGSEQFHGNDFVFKSKYNFIPTDLYYSDISGEYPASHKDEWELSDGGHHAERYCGNLDRVNGVSDVFVGRAPTDTEAEVDLFITKTVNYETYARTSEQSPPLSRDFAVSVLLGAQNWDYDVEDWLDEAAVGKEEIRHLLRGFEYERWIIRRRYQDWKDVPKPATQEPAERGDLRGFDPRHNLEEFLQWIGRGSNIVSLSGHGQGAVLAFIDVNDFTKKRANAGVYYGNGCYSNVFDEERKNSLSIGTILDRDGGAVAFVGNSRLGWTDDNPNEYAFWEEMLNSGRLGKMFNACREYGDGWATCSLNLLGDPAMRVWTNRPKTPQISCPVEITAGTDRLLIDVSSQGDDLPVEGATVCAIVERKAKGSGHYDLLAKANTDDRGTAELGVTLGLGDKVEVWVSGKNLIPTRRCVRIVPRR